ncbi:hypothetical protein [Streptomyces sp. NPDC001903]|uniref:hypothetical protein n=1 Tax=Streptomyces sp. NPDC001903 TaxID=3364622 RepID=UPI0036B9D024
MLCFVPVVSGMRRTAAAGRAMRELFRCVKSHAGVEPAVYTVGPLLFHVGLLLLGRHVEEPDRPPLTTTASAGR